MEIMKGDKRRETRRQRQPQPAQNGDHEGRQMKGDKAAAAANRTQNGDGRQGGSGSQEQPRMEIMKSGSGSQDQPRMEIMKGVK